MKLGRWSTTAGNNNSSPPDGAPEGMAPSTVNDTMREGMASIRTAFNDLQFFDQDFTPTYVNATSFTVAGNQTSAIHAGRRLKLFDATAGVATVIYATVLTASFTAVTTISVSADAGQLTASLSSFAISILSNTNDSLPRNAVISASAIAVDNLTVNGTASISGAAVLKGALSVGGATNIAGTLSAAAITTPMVYAKRSDNLQAVTVGVANTIIFDTETIDNRSFYNNATGVFLPTRAGKYQINAMAEPVSISATAGGRIQLLFNGATAVETGARVGMMPAQTASMTYHSIKEFNGVSDSAQIQVVIIEGGLAVFQLLSSSYLSIVYLGA